MPTLPQTKAQRTKRGILIMKKVILTAVLLLTTAYAVASCPPYAPYRCYTGMNGKMVCGCGV